MESWFRNMMIEKGIINSTRMASIGVANALRSDDGFKFPDDPDTYSVRDTTLPDIPQCVDINPYVLKNDGWVPQHIYRVSRTVYSFLAIYMTFIFLLAVFLNLIVIVATIKNRVLRQPLNYIIVNLAVVDLLSGFFGSGISIFANASGYFFMGKTWCMTEGYVVSNFGVTGLLSIAVMAFERYFVICKPFGPIPFKQNHAILGIVFTWLYAMFWNTPPLIWWDGYDTEGVGTSCAPNWFVTDPNQRLFIVLYFVFCFAIPLTLIVLCYGKLIWTLRQIAKESSSGGKNPEADVTKMVVVMVAAFVLAWLPYASFAMYNVINPDAQINYGLGAFPAFFAKSATIYNPLIYIGLNRQFRDCVIKMFFKGKNPWSDEGMGATSTTSQVTTVSTNQVAPAP